MAKAVNYTPEMESRIAEVLKSDVDQKSAIAELAAEFGKTVASVRAKASRMGLYRKVERTRKDGTKAESKGDLANEIASLLGVNVEVAESLANANRPILVKVRDALKSE